MFAKLTISRFNNSFIAKKAEQKVNIHEQELEGRIELNVKSNAEEGLECVKNTG